MTIYDGGENQRKVTNPILTMAPLTCSRSSSSLAGFSVARVQCHTSVFFCSRGPARAGSFGAAKNGTRRRFISFRGASCPLSSGSPFSPTTACSAVSVPNQTAQRGPRTRPTHAHYDFFGDSRRISFALQAGLMKISVRTIATSIKSEPPKINKSLQRGSVGEVDQREFESFQPQPPFLKGGVRGLAGVCACGKSTVTASGDSILDFITHSSAPRAASGNAPWVQMSAFRRCDVEFRGAVQSSFEHPELQPTPETRNEHFFCGECKTYLGLDATRWLGFAAISANLFPEASRPKPQMHVFYESREADVEDNLPKWNTVPGVGSCSTIVRDPQSGDEAGRITTMYNKLRGKDVLPVGPVRPPYEREYHFVQSDPAVCHENAVAQHKVAERKHTKYIRPTPEQVSESLAAAGINAKTEYDAIIIGGGHNGLTAAAYLTKFGGLKNVLVLERRPIVGGACITEEMVPGFKFSRASYLAGLLRPSIIKDLELERHGFEYLTRHPSSFTPTRTKGEYLFLGCKDEKAEIAKFSRRDAEQYEKYEEFLAACREMIQPLLDAPLPDVLGKDIPMRERVQGLKTLAKMGAVCWRHRKHLPWFYELFTGPSQNILDRWFESEILKTTLATDAVIGALVSTKQAGSSYVLLHHVMGEAAGQKGVWAYVRGGMGAISNALAKTCEEHGVKILTNCDVDEILLEPPQEEDQKMKKSHQQRLQATGVRLLNGVELKAKRIISACTPYQTFLEMMPFHKDDLKLEKNNIDSSGQEKQQHPHLLHQQAVQELQSFSQQIRFHENGCGAFKINCALSELPNFICHPAEIRENTSSSGHSEASQAHPAQQEAGDKEKPGRPPPLKIPGPQHMGTIHFEEKMEEMEHAYREASAGIPATKPIVEMTIPSSVDDTLAPPGMFVAQLFVQYAPYEIDPKIGSWADPVFKRRFVERVFAVVDSYCLNNFTESVVGYDAISPLDLERTFSLHKGNIFHGSLSLHQLAYSRPVPGWSSHRTPVKGLYLCAAGTHPGGGVMGAPGKNCARIVMNDL